MGDNSEREGSEFTDVDHAATSRSARRPGIQGVLVAHLTPDPEPGVARRLERRGRIDQDGAADARSTPCIVLAGLPALYGLGLKHALQGADVGPVVVVEREDLSSVLSGIGQSLLVVGSDDVEDVRALASLVAPDHPAMIVEVTSEASAMSFASAVRRGAVGVLQSDTGLDVAVEVVRSASVGCVLVPDHVAQALDTPVPTPTPPALDEREHQWLRDLSRGTTVAALASASAYSEREMYRLLAKLYARLGADSRTSALLRAERFGLLSD